MNKNKHLEDAVFSLILDHHSLTEQQKQILSHLPQSELETQKLEKIAQAITHLPERPMPLFLKVKLMHRLMGPAFHFWQICLVLLALLSTSGALLVIDNWNTLGQVFQIIVGCLISLVLIPMSFFIYFQYEKQSTEIEKRIDYNLNHIADYFKKRMDIKF